MHIRNDKDAQRFVLPMQPRDAFVTYSKSGDHITLTHIETPAEKRGTGLGARLAFKVFPLVKEMGGTASITCGFMRSVAGSREEWADYFGISR